MVQSQHHRRPEPPREQRPPARDRQRAIIEVELPGGARPQSGDRWEHAGATWLVLLADQVDTRHARLTLIRGGQT